MTNKILPIHFVYHDRRYDDCVNQIMMEFISKLQSPKFNSVRINEIRMGMVLDAIKSPRDFQVKKQPSAENKNFRIEFAGMLSRIIYDYQQIAKLESAEIYRPEIIVFMTTNLLPMPYKNGWIQTWDELVSKYNANIEITYFLRKDQNQITDEKFIKNAYPDKATININNYPSGSDMSKLLKQVLIGPGLEYRVTDKVNKFLQNTPTVLLSTMTQQNHHNTSSPKQENPVVSNNNQSVKPPTELKQQPTVTREEVKGDSHPKLQSGAPVVEVIEEKEPSQPIPVKPVQPAVWQVKDPPPDLLDPTSHIDTDDRPGPKGWFIYGASRRGRLHEHEATFREDAMAIDEVDGWLLVAVADGAGSHYLSRVGSNLAVQTSLSKMREVIKDPEGGSPTKFVVKIALEKALQGSWQALYEEYKKRNIEFKDLSTTLLLLMYYPAKELVGVAQVGDGLIAAQLDDGKIALLGKPESGEYAGQTYFITNHKKEELGSKVDVLVFPGAVRYFFVMTDGVADDLYPPQDRLPVLIKALPAVIKHEYPSKALLNLINYDRPGSFDDRTLVVICQKEKIIALPENSEKAPESRSQNSPSEKDAPKEQPSEKHSLPNQPSTDNDTRSVQAGDDSNLDAPNI